MREIEEFEFALRGDAVEGGEFEPASVGHVGRAFLVVTVVQCFWKAEEHKYPPAYCVEGDQYKNEIVVGLAVYSTGKDDRREPVDHRHPNNGLRAVKPPTTAAR